MNRSQRLLSLLEDKARFKIQNRIAKTDVPALVDSLKIELDPDDVIEEGSIVAMEGRGWELTLDINDRVLSYSGPENKLKLTTEVLTGFGYEFKKVSN